MKKQGSSTPKILATAVLGAGALLVPIESTAQESATTRVTPKIAKESHGKTTALGYLKFGSVTQKGREGLSIVGMEEGTPVYRNSKGELFTLDPNTGDMKVLAMDMFIKFASYRDYIKMNSNARSKTMTHIKFDGIKGEANLTAVGRDSQGHVLHSNAKGEVFYLDPKTGDMVFVR